jgi:hypothetical protein
MGVLLCHEEHAGIDASEALHHLNFTRSKIPQAG